MESILPFTVTIPSYKARPEGKKVVVFYRIEISEKDANEWTVEKRYREFDALDKALRSIYDNLPALPGKGLFALKKPTELKKRKEGLEKYLRHLVTRTDIINSDIFKRFLQPPKHLKHLGNLTGLAMGVRDFLYQPEEKLLFVAISRFNIAIHYDIMWLPKRFPWEEYLGAVECYVQKEDIENEIKFERLWRKTFQSQVICLHWDQTSNNLLIGTDDGTLTILKVAADSSYTQFEEVLVDYKLHTSRIRGVYFDSISENVYTVSEDKKFKVYNPRNKAIVAIYCGAVAGNDAPRFSSHELTGLVADRENRRLFITSRDGRVFIYDIAPVIPKILHSFQAHPKGAIRGVFFDPIKNYLITANYYDGALAITDLLKPGQEKFAYNIANLQGEAKVRFVAWSSIRNEIYSGDEDGNVTFWDARKGAPLFTKRIHDGDKRGVTKIQWLEKSSILITAGRDHKISFYQLPSAGKESEIGVELAKDVKIQKQADAMLEFQKQQQKKKEENFDQDDLAGWDK